MVKYGTAEVPTLAIESELLNDLDQNDDYQTSLMEEAVILVNERDEVIGKESKAKAHHKAGVLHRAFSVLVFNSNRELLIQKRAQDKVTFPGVWANSCCSHPLSYDDELEDSVGVKRAAVRKLVQELGVNADAISVDDFQFVTRFMYSARMNETWIEREVDHVLLYYGDLEINPNPSEIEDVRWVNEDDLESMLIDENEIIAPWFRVIAARLMDNSWWEQSATSDNMIHDMGDISHMLPYADGAGLNTSIAEVKPQVESRIESILTSNTHSTLSKAMMHLIQGGGKRLRATLPWLVAKAVGDTNSAILDVGAAIETIHNFTLIHDDIMDDDPIRRGRNAVHVEYDVPTAINAGDAMLAIAFESLANADGVSLEDLPILVRRLGGMVRQVAEGQQLDIEFELKGEVTEDEYLKMIQGKTAVMFQTCAEVGAYLAGCDEETVQCMSDWGLHLGLCFQLMDDLIDVVSDSTTLGKPSGSDIAQGKRTLMVIHALKQPDSEAKKDLLNVLGLQDEADEGKIAKGIESLHKLGSIDYAMALAKDFHKKAHQCLDALPLSPGMKALRELTDYQLNRLS